MYYEIEAVRWCIAIKGETRMRLTYQRDYIPERQLWRDFLVSAEPITGNGEVAAASSPEDKTHLVALPKGA